MSVLAAFAVPHPPLIIPEVGKGEEKKIRKTVDAYREVMRRAADLKPDTIVITTPHSIMYSDYFHISPGRRADGDFSRFAAPGVRLHAEYDVEFTQQLCFLCEDEGIPAGTLGERERRLDHAAMIPMYFLNEFLSDYKVVRIGLSGLPPLTHYRFGGLIARVAESLGRRTVFIASGDLSHKLTAGGPYGFSPDGPVFDERICGAFGSADFGALLRLSPALCDGAAECGWRSFLIMAGALDGKSVNGELLSYEGPFGVGYGVAAFTPGVEDGARFFGAALEAEEKARLSSKRSGEDEYVRLARLSLETFVRTGRRLERPEGLSAELTERRAGAFVSLHKDGELRGCIGTIAPTTRSVADEILQNAVSACSQDPRFPPVRSDELGSIEYSVDVLGEAEQISSPDMLDVKRYGVIVESGRRRGLLLPDLDGVDTIERQIAIARRKAGIDPDEPVTLSRFEVVRHS